MERIKEIIKASNGRIFRVTFIKKDGTIREMSARLGVKKGLVGGELRYNPDDFGYLPVYDVSAKAYRVINLHTVTSIKSEGKEYLILEK